MVHFIERFVFGATLTLAVYILLRIIFLAIQKPRSRPAKEILIGICAMYFGGLMFLVWWQPVYESPFSLEFITQFFSRLGQTQKMNLEPFRSIKDYFRYASTQEFFINIISNVTIFIPAGFMLPLLWKRWQNFFRILLFALLFPLFIESSQLYTGRHFDIDDLILNFTGIMLGYIIFTIAAAFIPVLRRFTASEASVAKQ